MLSYSRGPDEELWEFTIGQVLDRAVERWGDDLALVSCHQSKRLQGQKNLTCISSARVAVPDSIIFTSEY